MRLRKGLGIVQVIFHFQLACSLAHSQHIYDVTCTLQQSSSSSPSSILLSSLSPSASSISAGDLSEIKYKSSCTTENNDTVSSEMTGDDGVYCLTFACHCDGLRLKKMATCHQVDRVDVTINCPCCSHEETVCTWTEPHKRVVISSTTTSRGPLFHFFNKDPKESKEPMKQMYVIIFIVSGIIFISAFMFLYIFCKLKNFETSDDSRNHYFTIAHSFAYAKLYQKKTCKTVQKSGKTNAPIHCVAKRSRNPSFNGGELANKPIPEGDEENVEK